MVTKSRLALSLGGLGMLACDDAGGGKSVVL